MKAPPSRLRIIAGRWRGRRLSFPAQSGVRPTPDRVRETLFNWLAPGLPGSRCLDLFAGSGALGIEALSRGAGEVVLVEQQPPLAQAIRDNLAALEAQHAEVIRAEALTWLRTSPRPFDIVFLDPPFRQGLLTPVFAQLAQGWLHPAAQIYVETARDEGLDFPSTWEPRREKTAGDVCFRLFQVHLGS